MTPSFVEFAIIWTIATIPFGPNALLSVDSAIRNGWPKALAAPIGISIAAIIYAVFSVTILGTILAVYSNFVIYATVIGAFYLIYIGSKIARRGIIETELGGEGSSGFSLGMKGVLTSLSNPKAALMYLAVIPNYLSNDTSMLATTALIVIAVLIVFLTYCGYSLVARSVRWFFIDHPRRQILFNYFSALNYYLIGMYFLYTAFQSFSQ